MTRLLSIALVVAALAGGSHAAPLRIATLEEVQEGWTASLSARWRDLGQDARGEPNMFLEAPALTPPPDVQSVVSPLRQSDVPFSFSYDAASNVGAMSLDRIGISFDYSGLSRSPAQFDDLLIKIRVPKNGAIGLTELVLDGTSLIPNFTANRFGGEQFWLVLDAIKGDSFELLGHFSGGGLNNSNEGNRFEVIAGNYLAPIPLPGGLALLMGGLAGLGLLARRRTRAA